MPVGGLIVPYGIFFSPSALIAERAEGAPAEMPTPKSCECKGEPLVSVSLTAVLYGWMSSEDLELHKATSSWARVSSSASQTD